MKKNHQRLRPEREHTHWVAASADGLDITRGWISALQERPRRGADLSAQALAEVLADDTVRACALQRIHGITARAWEVVVTDEGPCSQEVAGRFRQNIERLEWDRITAQMLRAGIFTGRTVAEVLWTVEGSQVSIADIAVRDSARFGFDGAGQLRLRTLHNPSPGQQLPERKFWVCRFGAAHADDVWGHALAGDLYWLVWLKRHALRFWSVYLEKFGTPTVLGRYPVGTQPDEQQRLLDALAAIERDSTIIVPEGVQVQLLEAMRGGAADHAGFVQLIDRAITKAILGQTATVEGQAGRLGASDEQDRARAAIQQSDADTLSASFNTSIARWWCDFNYGTAQSAPQLWRVFDHEGTAERLERDRAIFDMGFRPSIDYIRSNWGEHWSEDSAAPVTAAPTQPDAHSPSASADHGEGIEPAPAAANAVHDAAPDADLAAALAHAQPAIEGVLARIVQTIEEAADMDAAADALLDVLAPILSEGELHRAMAAALELAALRGWEASAQSHSRPAGPT